MPFAARFLVFACSLAVAARVASAQETLNHASLSGSVTDPSGAVVVEAQVVARQLDTNLSSAIKTDQEGRFRFPYLRVGLYEIVASQAGFADAVQSVRLTVGAAVDMPIRLQVGSPSTRIEVSGGAAVLEASRSQAAGTLLEEEITSLPLNGRNFLDLALAVPGVSPTNTASTQLFAETSAVPGQGISVNSQRNFSNSFIVDGLSANDDAAGLSGTFYGLGVVQEFQVVTSGAQAEFGRALGGYISMVTKSGTNSIHGEVYGFLRNQSLNAANALTHTVLPMTQAQYGASLGGPIARDRTFYFVNFEQRRLHQSGLATINPADVLAINTRLAEVGYSGSPVATGLYPNPVHNTNILAKVDHLPGDRDQLSARYSLYTVTSENSRGAGGLSASSASAGLYNIDQTLAVSNIATLSSRVVNETRGQFIWSSLEARPTDPIGPAVRISGVASFGTLSVSPTSRRNDLLEIADNFTYQHGRHAVRAGVDFLHNDATIMFPRAFRGSYTFSSLASFLNGIYTNSGFTQTFGNPVVAQRNPNVGLYVQDEWKVRRGLILNIGVRYDLQFLRTISTDTNNFSPRVGLAWSPFDSNRTIIRGSYGLFYDRVPLRALANALLSAGNTTELANLNQSILTLSPTQDGAPVFPAILESAMPSVTLPNLTTMDRHIQNAYSEQVNVEIEQRLGETRIVSIGYQYVRGLHLIMSINRNAPVCAATGSNNGCRPNPDYGNNSQYSSGADSHYDGLYVSFIQRPGRWGSFRLSYTYSKALDNVGEFFFSAPIDNFDIWKDYGRSDDDQRHRVVFDGTIRTPMSEGSTLWERMTHGFELSGAVQYYSALPFNIVTGGNTIQGTTARPIENGRYIARNSGSGFDFFTAGARVSRTFTLGERLHMQLMVEAFNILNHVNGVALNNTFGRGVFPADPSPAFGQTTAVGEPRSVQLAMRFTFG